MDMDRPPYRSLYSATLFQVMTPISVATQYWPCQLDRGPIDCALPRNTGIFHNTILNRSLRRCTVFLRPVAARSFPFTVGSSRPRYIFVAFTILVQLSAYQLACTFQPAYLYRRKRPSLKQKTLLPLRETHLWPCSHKLP